MPICTVEGDDFIYLLTLYDPVYDCIEKIHEYIQTVNSYSNKDLTLLDHCEDVTEQMLFDLLDQSDAYQQFMNDGFSQYATPEIPSHIKSSVYHSDNVGVYLISLDMKHAGFNVLKYYSEKLVLGSDTWEDLLGRYTDDAHLLKSRGLRHSVCKCINASKQIQLMQFLTFKVYQKLLSFRICKNIDVVAMLCEEIIFRVELDDLVDTFQKTCEFVKNQVDVPMRVECFQLFEYPSSNMFYVRETFEDVNDLTKTIPSFKQMAPEQLPQCFKYYHNLEIEYRDVRFLDNSMNRHIGRRGRLFE
eukprot:TRINITY_DN3492_c2_g1_i1.p1 TRINITY_DN3492_c2_g1~~TRINITY_DN3492_c2_g1_i1.p1  ORF type:complete len:302 (-),score=42.40 TRINITY_DN3492_c2_g1_i1:28-933(-)